MLLGYLLLDIKTLWVVTPYRLVNIYPLF